MMSQWVGNQMMSQWVVDVAIVSKQSCDQQLGKPGSFTQNPGSRKTWTFHL